MSLQDGVVGASAVILRGTLVLNNDRGYHAQLTSLLLTLTLISDDKVYLVVHPKLIQIELCDVIAIVPSAHQSRVFHVHTLQRRSKGLCDAFFSKTFFIFFSYFSMYHRLQKSVLESMRFLALCILARTTGLVY